MERSGQIEQVVASWFGAASRGDGSIVDELLSTNDGVRLIGSDPAELYAGGPAVAEFLKGEVEGAGGDVTFSPADVIAFEEGSVGWATANLTITLPDGKYVSPRWSAVLHSEDERWKFVHIHASIGIANQDVGWVYSD